MRRPIPRNGDAGAGTAALARGGAAAYHATVAAWLNPKALPYDALEWEKLPLGERLRLACTNWAVDGYGAPLAIWL